MLLTHKPKTASSNLALGTKEKPANLRVFLLFLEKSILFYTIFSPHLGEGDFLSFNFKFKPRLLRQRAELVGLKGIPTPHDFRRSFALIMLRNGVNIFALQKLMGHSDLQVLRRYLAQTDQDIHAHVRGSPVDSNL